MSEFYGPDGLTTRKVNLRFSTKSTHAPMINTAGSHYLVRITDLPPSELYCKCGEVFTGGGVFARMRAHISVANQKESNERHGNAGEGR